MRVQWLIAGGQKPRRQRKGRELVHVASLRTTMHILVARGTERNKVPFRIISGLAATLLMMNLKVQHYAACLASPPIPSQHFFTKLLVRFGIQPQRDCFGRIRFMTPSESHVREMSAVALRAKT